jgi:hypothetical protein
MMINNISRTQWAAAWFAMIVVLFAVSVIAGASTSAGARALWLLASLAPPVVMLLVWRPQTRTVAEVLYSVNHPDKDGTP